MIKHLKGLEINSIYDFDNAFSINELLCKFWEKIEETINISNESIDILNWLKEQGLPNEVQALITQMVNDGTIEQMINIDKIEELRTLINTHKEEITELGSQLDNIMNFQGDPNITLIDNIDGFPSSKGKKVDLDHLRTIQIVGLGEFYKKLYTTGYINICCVGDSLTYGHDEYSSDKRPALSGHNFTRASVTYPEALQSYMNLLFENRVTVENRGYSSDTTELSYKRWNLKHDSDLTVIMIGTNNAIVELSDDKTFNIEYFINWYEQIIIRELMWGNPVLILTPPKMRNVNDLYNRKIEVIRDTVIKLGEKYLIDVIDTEEFFRNYTSEIYSDMTHFNSIGYSILGAKTTCAIVSRDKNNIVNGTKLGVRKTMDNAFYNTNVDIIESSYSSAVPNITSPLIASFRSGGKIYFPIYCQVDDIKIIPIIALGANIPIKVELLFGLANGENTLDYAITDKNDGATSSDNNLSYVEYVSSTAQVVTKMKSFNFLKLSKGYNVICVSGDGGALNGFEFIDNNILYLLKK